MTTIKIPYARKFVDVKIPDANLQKILEFNAHHYKTEIPESELVERALDNPIESASLIELAKGKKNIVIITSDHTRPVPSKITLPIVLRKIREVNPDAEITILIATGFHRPTSEEEMNDKFGEEIVKNERLVNHFSRDKEDMVYIGKLPSGGDILLNKLAVEADLLIAEGFIEPHFFAGFSGGRKSVLPGIAAKETVLANHCSEFIANQFARTGNLENNPIHEDMIYAAKKAKLAFILNVVINAEKQVINAFAGHFEKAHLKGTEFVSKLAQVSPCPADIVVTSNGGYPLDQNIYQSVKGMTAAEATAAEGGVIIIISACNDGHGGQSFYEALANVNHPREWTDKVLQIPRDKTLPDQWESQILARILEKHEVILVTDQCDKKMIEDMHMKYAISAEEALKMAFEMKGKDATITVVPDGVSVIVK
ncbi:MAG: nickel-dependent lactate racemase [Halanaerobiales bacterium]|nr:nickel-dependent lactate racemase [Halanaerobiales bacterium]